MQLIGSTTSPYVRRIRLFMDNYPHEFIALNIYSPEGRDALRKFTPVMKVPVLTDDDKTLLDSRVIHKYLANKLNHAQMSWDQENLLTMIDAVNDSCITLFMLTRSGISTEEELLIADLQKERIANTINLLEAAAANGSFDEWHYPSICLYCLLDWVSFRELLSLEETPALAAFLQSHKHETLIKNTDPRL
ncbi:glutathione S-transferase N-terminal domain-containing protein [Neptunomonas phycophila]|uniref:glutathione S-transferase family protein n=1 Tax=Neptunomonas phycophila TaxID=1572645 RepID=UPI0026E46B08|nr:glutathione S-transferase N-terminal domain-containing protein [Neptunomonas phycophila]MDO6784160.1 glutathione S-transferase N-terminal domain-containing protein [Neptunomonas phycophila]